ncbi:hypothetical protein VTH06DRAFT_1863 [Thermothelomyces fergusii]
MLSRCSLYPSPKQQAKQRVVLSYTIKSVGIVARRNPDRASAIPNSLVPNSPTPVPGERTAAWPATISLAECSESPRYLSIHPSIHPSSHHPSSISHHSWVSHPF